MKARFVEPPVEERYEWLRLTAVICKLTAGVLIAFGAGLSIAAVIGVSMFRSDVLLILGIGTLVIGLLTIFLIFPISEAIHVFLAIEENTRKLTTMSQYTMQTTHNLTAIYDVTEELNRRLYANNQQLAATASDVQELRERVDALAEYARVSAIIAHRQYQQSQHEPHPATPGSNGSHPRQPVTVEHEALQERELGSERLR